MTEKQFQRTKVAKVMSYMAYQELEVLYDNYLNETRPNFKYPVKLTKIINATKPSNMLTKAVIYYVRWKGYQAERINTQGQYRDNRKRYVDTVGFLREIGSAGWVKGAGTKGSADISATVKGLSVKLEIKYGKDRQSTDQKKYQTDIERAGGKYYIIRTLDDAIQAIKEVERIMGKLNL